MKTKAVKLKQEEYKPKASEDDVFMIKYRVMCDGRLKSTAYSQIHDEFLNIKDGTSYHTKIASDMKFYKNSMLLDDHDIVHIEVLINNRLYQTHFLKGDSNA